MRKAFAAGIIAISVVFAPSADAIPDKDPTDDHRPIECADGSRVWHKQQCPHNPFSINNNDGSSQNGRGGGGGGLIGAIRRAIGGIL